MVATLSAAVEATPPSLSIDVYPGWQARLAATSLARDNTVPGEAQWLAYMGDQVSLAIAHYTEWPFYEHITDIHSFHFHERYNGDHYLVAWRMICPRIVPKLHAFYLDIFGDWTESIHFGEWSGWVDGDQMIGLSDLGCVGGNISLVTELEKFDTLPANPDLIMSMTMDLSAMAATDVHPWSQAMRACGAQIGSTVKGDVRVDHGQLGAEIRLTNIAVHAGRMLNKEWTQRAMSGYILSAAGASPTQSIQWCLALARLGDNDFLIEDTVEGDEPSTEQSDQNLVELAWTGRWLVQSTGILQPKQAFGLLECSSAELARQWCVSLAEQLGWDVEPDQQAWIWASPWGSVRVYTADNLVVGTIGDPLLVTVLAGEIGDAPLPPASLISIRWDPNIPMQDGGDVIAVINEWSVEYNFCRDIGWCLSEWAESLPRDLSDELAINVSIEGMLEWSENGWEYFSRIHHDDLKTFLRQSIATYRSTPKDGAGDQVNYVVMRTPINWVVATSEYDLIPCTTKEDVHEALQRAEHCAGPVFTDLPLTEQFVGLYVNSRWMPPSGVTLLSWSFVGNYCGADVVWTETGLFPALSVVMMQQLSQTWEAANYCEQYRQQERKQALASAVMEDCAAILTVLRELASCQQKFYLVYNRYPSSAEALAKPIDLTPLWGGNPIDDPARLAWEGGGKNEGRRVIVRWPLSQGWVIELRLNGQLKVLQRRQSRRLE